MPQPTIAAKTARFGGLALPATGAVQSFINLNDCQQWFLHLTGKGGQFGLADSNRQIGVAPLRWRGRGVYLSDDFGVRVITLPERYYEGTELGGAGNPLAQGIAQLSQAGEQYLTFDNKTFIRVKLRKVNNRVLDRGFTPYWWSLNLEFMARDPWARDFQASGSLANLLNPNGGFEVAGATVALFRAIGSDAKEGAAALTDWTIDAGAPTKTANVATMPNGGQMRAGHADWTDLTNVQAQFTFSTSSQPSLLLHGSASNSWVRVRVDGTNLHLDKDVAGTTTNDVTTAVAAALTNGTKYWLQGIVSGTTFTGKVLNDSTNTPGTTIATISATITDSAVASGYVGLANPGTASCTFGTANANVFLVQGDGKGWTPNDVGTTADCAFCVSKVSPQGGTYSGSITNVNASSNGYWSFTFNAAAATYNYRGYEKATGAGTASINLGGSGLQSVTQDGAWHQTADASLVLSAGSTTFRCQLNGVGTAYFDNLTLQQSLDSLTGLYSQAFQDQVALTGSTGAGTTTTTTINYPGGVWAEPLYQVTIPATNGAAISSITIVNQTTGVGLTFNFTTALAASLAQNFQVDCAAITASIGSTQYDWTAPNGAKCGFPFLYPGNNSIAVTIVTTSGTTTGVALDTSWVNRWEL